MTSEQQSLAQNEINANKLLGYYWDQHVDSATYEYPATGADILRVDIPRATAVNTASQLKISDYTTTNSYSEPDYIMKLRELLFWRPSTDIKHNEILGHPTLDVFEELQKIRADETHFRSLLRDIPSLTDVRERESIAIRLEALLGDFQDDYGRCLDAESLRTFVTLFSLHPELSKPIITAAENGNLFAEWKAEDGKRFLGLQMLPTHQVRFVAIRPHAKYPQLRNYNSGVTSVEQLFTDLDSYDILSWACAA